GAPVDLAAYGAHERRRRVALPTYPFQRQRHWIDAPAAQTMAPPQTASIASIAPPAPAPLSPLSAIEDPAMSPAHPSAPPSAPAVSADRRARLLATVCEVVEEVSGTDVSGADPNTPWLDLGMDSLALTQLALSIQRTTSIKVSFRQVMEQYPTIAALVA